MKRSLILSICAITLMACSMSSVRADEIDVTLEFSGGAWQVYAEVNDTAGPANGSVGIAALNILLDNIDFGTNGNGVTFEAGALNAVNPIDQGGPNERLPVLLRSSGTVDIIYGQDVSLATTGGVGIGGRAFIASGTYTIGTDPAFGSFGSSVTAGNFLTSTAANSAAISPDNVNLAVNPVGGDFLLLGDSDNDGDVDGNDLGAVQIEFGSTGAISPHLLGDADHDGDVDGNDLGAVQIEFGSVASSANITAVPEPSTLVMLISCGFLSFRRRR